MAHPQRLLTALLFIPWLNAAAVDVVELRDGEELRGRFLGATTSILRIELEDGTRTIPVDEIKALRFGERRNTPAPSQGRFVVDTGTTLRVRTDEALSSHRARNGDRFRAVLLEDMVATGEHVLAEAGQAIWGRVIAARRPPPGEAEGILELELAEVDIEGRVRPLKTFKHVLVEAGEHDTPAREGEVRIGAGSILEFRLAQPLIVRESRY